MKIISEKKESFINITLVEAELKHLPSICVAINIEDNLFIGRNDQIWIEVDQLKKFLEKLGEIYVELKEIKDYILIWSSLFVTLLRIYTAKNLFSKGVNPFNVA